MKLNTAMLSGALRVALAAACVTGFAALSAAQEDSINVATEIVNLNVAVVNRQGQRISGLSKDDFEVFEDGTRQEIVFFAPAERPLKLVLLFDTSISMVEMLPAVKQEATKLLGGLQTGDEVTVISFATGIERHCVWAARDEAERAISKLAPEDHPTPQPPAIGRAGYNVGDGNTYLYEALRYVLKNFRADDDDRIAVVIFSDGVDTRAGRSIAKIRDRADTLGEEVLRYAEESWALLYPIRYETKQFIGSLPEPAWRPARAIKLGRRPDDPGRKLFSEIATTSGGDVFEWTTRRDLTSAVQNALADLRSRYEVAYRPSRATRVGEFRRVKVRLKRPGVIARTREGYRVTK